MNRRDERKLQVIELQNNYSPVAKYNPFEVELEKNGKISRKKKKIVLNKFISWTVLYIIIFIIAAMTKMFVVYEISNLGLKKIAIENRLNEVKVEVESLENTYISNYDLKKVEEKAKELGFVPNTNIKYVNISK